MQATFRPGAVLLLVATALLGAAACAPPPPSSVTAHWLAWRPVPAADPQAPPDELRWAIERLLGRGLMDEDSSGKIVPALARTVSLSEDQRTYTFVLRAGLRFASGDTLRSGDVRSALERGLARREHATQRWLLRSIEGVESIRPGRALPKLGIDVPDDSTLVLRLSRPDSLLLAALAIPGVSTPWRIAEAQEGWSALDGVGPYRLIEERPGRLLAFVRGDAGSLPVHAVADTLWLRFATGARARALLRGGTMDVAWPIPLGDPLPGDAYEGYRRASGEARPGRRLDLVLRADVAPTAKLAARRALAHSINRSEFERAVAEDVAPFRALWSGLRAFDFPRLDDGETLAWLARGKLGRSFHTTLVYDPDEVGGTAARRLQSQWARADLSVDLRPLRGSRLVAERIGGRAHLLLQVTQGLLDDPATDLAMIAAPGRDGPVGRVRTGWRTSDFRNLAARGARPEARDLESAQRAVEEATVVLPLGATGWTWIERKAARIASFHPHFGVDFANGVTSELTKR